MATGPSTLAKVSNILKEVYEPGVNDQLQSEVLTLRRIEKTAEGTGTNSVGGKYVRFAVRLGRNHGVGARSEYEVLPQARAQDYKDAQVGLAYFYGAVSLTGQTLELADTDTQAFASALDLEMNGMQETLAKDMNRQVYGSSSAIMSTANGAGSTTTFVTTPGDGKYLENGMFIDIWDTSAAGFMTGGPFTITDVSDNAAGTVRTVTYTPASGAATASGDTIRRQGSSIDATTGKEISGFTQIISNAGTLFNIDPTVAGQGAWRSTVNSNAGTPRALSEALMIKLVHDIRVQGARPSVIFTSLGVQRQYFLLLSQQREFVNTQTFTGGFEGLAFAGAGGQIPVVEDVDAPDGKMWFVTEKELKLYQNHDWKWMDREGSKWKQGISISGGTVGYVDVYTALLYKYCQLGTHRRNSHGLLSDITQ